MKTIIAILFLTAGCGASPPGAQHHPLAGDSCDPFGCQLVADGTMDRCPGDGSVGCSVVCPDCGDGMICTSSGVCGSQCGNGNVSCDSGTICTLQSDCVPPCLVGGQPYQPPVSGCANAGLLTAVDGTCIVPCWYFLCSLVGGSC